MSSEDLVIVTQMLAGILNPNNTIRKEAEGKLQQMQENIGALLFCLGKVLKDVNDSKIKSLAAVLLRKLLDLEGNVWKEKLNDQMKAALKADLLTVMISENEKYVKFKICDAVSKLAENIYENDQTWNELLNHIYTVLNTPYNDANLLNIEVALQLLTSMFGYVCDEVMKGIAVLLNTFKNYFKINNNDLRAKTVQTLSEIITICDKKDVKHFRDFVFYMLETTMRCIDDIKEENNLKHCLSSILDICESEPNLLRKSFADLYVLMTKIMDKKDFADSNLRELGYEVVISIVERIPKLFEKDEIKLKDYLERLFKYSLEMENEIDQEWCTPKTDSYFEEEFIPEENVSTSLSIMVRMIECLGKKFFLPYVSEIVMQLIQNDKDWRYKYVAFMTIAQIVEFIDDMSNIENLLPIIFSNISNTNPKIRYAAIYCIDLFSEGFQPHFQEKFNEKVVQSLLFCLKDNVLRIQLESCEALESFLEHCTNQAAGQYAQFILDSTFQVFLQKDCPTSLREQILSVVAELIASADQSFTPYSENCLKILLNFFSEIFASHTLKPLYGTLIECITLTGPLCKDAYLKYVKDLVKAIINIQEQSTTANDFTKDYLQNAWQRICPVVKEHFSEMIPEIVESALKIVNVDILMSISNKPEETFKIEDLISSLEPSVKIEKTKVNFTTSGTQDKSMAIELLNEIITVFDTQYLPFVEATQKIILPLLSYNANHRVRGHSSCTLPLILKIVKNSNNNNALVSLAKLYISTTVIQSEKEQDNSTLSQMLDNLSECFEITGEKFLEPNELNDLFEKILIIFADTEKRRRLLIDKQDKLDKLEEEQEKEGKEIEEDSDQEDENDYANDLEQDIEDIEDILVSLADFIGVLFKTHKQAALSIVDKLTKIVLPEYFKATSSNFELKMGIFIVDDMVEHLGQELLSGIWKDLASILIKYCTNESPEIRQAAVYGLGIFAKVTKSDFESYVDSFLEKIDSSINIKFDDQDEEEYGHSRDNSIAALGKIIIHQGKFIKTLDHWIKTWIDYLPLNYDEGESIPIHELLCNGIMNSAEIFLGKNHSNLFQIVKVLTTIYKTKHSNDKVDELAKTILKQIATNTQMIENFKICIVNLEEKLKKKLEEILA